MHIPIEKLIERVGGKDTYSNNAGIYLVKGDEHCVEAALPLTEKSANFRGALHGGAICTLADYSAGALMLQCGRVCVTQDMTTHFIKGINKGTAHAFATKLHMGKHTGVTRVDIKNDEGELCATVTVTMFLLDKPLSEYLQEHDGNA